MFPAIPYPVSSQNLFHTRHSRCVRNERGRGEWKKFYPFVSGDKIVCVSEKGLKMT